VRRFASLTLVLVLAGCTTSSSPDDPDGTLTPRPPLTAQQPAESPRPPLASASASPGWEVTVYYTAVAKFHSGDKTKVTGCPKIDCSHGRDELGSYPSDFVEAVKDEGAGKISDGKYLNWSYDTGYWLDSAARDTAGRKLRPFVSAAADSDVLKAGTQFDIVQCGHDESGDAIDADVCSRLKKSGWLITDEFTPGLGGNHHVDVYIGEETGPDFTDSPWYTTLQAAVLNVG
jgi:hypothetical protein